MARHSTYNTDNYPRFVINHGNWDIYANETGHCAAIPTKDGEANGCAATHFGDAGYVRTVLFDKLAEAGVVL
jgi:hypothetical protein